MNIVRWDPFRELEQIQARLNRVFGERRHESNLSFAAWAPAVDTESDALPCLRPIFQK